MKFLALSLLLLPLILSCSQKNISLLNDGTISREVASSSSFDRFFSNEEKYHCSPNKDIACKELFPLRSDSEIAILERQEDAFAARVKSLMAAKKSIRIQYLLFQGDETGRAIAEILKQKKKEGLSVEIIIDHPSNTLMSDSREMYLDLASNGIFIHGFHPNLSSFASEMLDRNLFNNRSHEKLWIIDGELDSSIAITGGLNIGNEYFRMGPAPKFVWRDQDVIVRGGVVKDMTVAFDRNLKFYETYLDFTGAKNYLIAKFPKYRPSYKNNRYEVNNKMRTVLAQPLNIKFEKADLRFFHNRPRFAETYILQAYLKLINSAQKEIIIENAYFIPRRLIREALKKAVLRGVNVSIMTNTEETNDLPGVTDAGRSFYSDLMSVNDVAYSNRLSSKMRIFEWHGEQGKEFTLHAKIAIFDDEAAIVASYNLDPRSEMLNNETGIAFRSRSLVDRLRNIAIQDFKPSKAREISYTEALNFERPDGVIGNIERWIGKKLSDWL